MSNYAIRQVSGTSTGSAVIQVGVISLMALAHLAQLDTKKSIEREIDLPKPQQVRIQENPKTYGQYSNLFTGEFEHSSVSFEETMVSFYTHLLAIQEPLGKEFEQVLHDNLWDLLVHT